MEEDDFGAALRPLDHDEPAHACLDAADDGHRNPTQAEHAADEEEEEEELLLDDEEVQEDNEMEEEEARAAAEEEAEVDPFHVALDDEHDGADTTREEEESEGTGENEVHSSADEDDDDAFAVHVDEDDVVAVAAAALETGIRQSPFVTMATIDEQSAAPSAAARQHELRQWIGERDGNTEDDTAKQAIRAAKTETEEDIAFELPVQEWLEVRMGVIVFFVTIMLIVTHHYYCTCYVVIIILFSL